MLFPRVCRVRVEVCSRGSYSNQNKSHVSGDAPHPPQFDSPCPMSAAAYSPVPRPALHSTSATTGVRKSKARAECFGPVGKPVTAHTEQHLPGEWRACSQRVGEGMLGNRKGAGRALVRGGKRRWRVGPQGRDAFRAGTDAALPLQATPHPHCAHEHFIQFVSAQGPADAQTQARYSWGKREPVGATGLSVEAKRRAPQFQCQAGQRLCERAVTS